MRLDPAEVALRPDEARAAAEGGGCDCGDAKMRTSPQGMWKYFCSSFRWMA